MTIDLGTYEEFEIERILLVLGVIEPNLYARDAEQPVKTPFSTAYPSQPNATYVAATTTPMNIAPNLPINAV